MSDVRCMGLKCERIYSKPPPGLAAALYQVRLRHPHWRKCSARVGMRVGGRSTCAHTRVVGSLVEREHLRQRGRL